LIEAGAILNRVSGIRSTALKSALVARNKPLVQYLIAQGADLRLAGEQGTPPIFEAARWGDAEVLDIFLGAGIDAKTGDHEGTTPLHLAAYGGANTVFQMLIARGADVGAISTRYGTPLHAAARQRQLAIAQALIRLGATPSQGAYTGENDAMGSGLENLLYADDLVRRTETVRALEHYAIARTFIVPAGEAYRKRASQAGSQALLAQLNAPTGLFGSELIMDLQAGQTAAQIAELSALKNGGSYATAYAQRYAQAVARFVEASGNWSAVDRDAIRYYGAIMRSNEAQEDLASAWVADIDRKVKCLSTAAADAAVACLQNR
jgi:hypothetical protein